MLLGLSFGSVFSWSVAFCGNSLVCGVLEELLVCLGVLLTVGLDGVVNQVIVTFEV